MSTSDLAIVAALVFAWGMLSARLERFDAARRHVDRAHPLRCGGRRCTQHGARRRWHRDARTRAPLPGHRTEFRAPLWDLLGDRRYCIYAVTHPEAAGVFVPAGRGDRWIYGVEHEHRQPPPFPGRPRSLSATSTRSPPAAWAYPPAARSWPAPTAHPPDGGHPAPTTRRHSEKPPRPSPVRPGPDDQPVPAWGGGPGLGLGALLP